MELTRTFDLLDRFITKFNRDNVLNSKQKGKWKGYSAEEYNILSHNFSYGLMAMGLKKGDKIATISQNRPEWNFVDMGMAMLGVVHVPVFTSLNVEEYKHIFEHSDARVVIVSDKSLLKKVKMAIEGNTKIEQIYSFDDIPDTPNWMEIVEKGKTSREDFTGKDQGRDK